MITCPTCYRSNPEGLKYCVACGHELDQGLSGFLQANGLGEHLEVFRQNDLLNVPDLLGLEDSDLRELKLPYGDVVRLRTALQAFRAEPEEEEEVVSVQPAPEPVVQQVAAAQPAPLVSAPQPAKSGAGKVVAWVVGGVVALVIIGVIGSGDPNNTSKEEELQEASPNLSNQAEQAAQEALERARQAEQELATMREKAAHAEKEKAEAQRIAAEQEAQPAKEAAPTSFVNSLGHRMIPVPKSGVLFSAWPARVSDYRKFIDETATAWKEPGFPQKPSHPAVRVNYYDASSFCRWLTDRERKSGKLPAGYEYRLPSDLEWSAAAGLAENPEGPPAWRSGAIPDCFPWGSSWPPPKGSGNYDSRLQADNFPYTSPVGSFAPNRLGLYDMSGNVFEWVADDFDQSGLGCLRGGSWPDESPVNLNLSTRCQDNKTTAHKCYGFRFVLAPVGS